MELEALCPYCGEPLGILVDEGGGAIQKYVEDCAVCCRPFEVRVGQDQEGELMVELHRLDE